MPKYQHGRPFDIIRTIKDMQLATKQLQSRSTPTSHDVSTDTGVYTNSNLTGTQALSILWTIPAYDPIVGTCYEIEVPYTGTVEGNALTLWTLLDGSTIAGNSVSGTLLTVGSTFNGVVRGKLQVTALTDSSGNIGTANVWLDGGFGISGTRASSNNVYLSAVSVSIAFDSTISHTFQLGTVWGAATAGQTISGYGSKFARSGPLLDGI